MDIYISSGYADHGSMRIITVKRRKDVRFIRYEPDETRD